MIFTTIWLGLIGGADDYIKVFLKNKDGLSGKTKIFGQVILGLDVGVTTWSECRCQMRKRVVLKSSRSILSHFPKSMTSRV